MERLCVVWSAVVYLSLHPLGPKEQISSDLCVINTCAVTQKASQQSRQAIRQLIRSQPRARFLVTGCYSQVEPEIVQKITGMGFDIIRVVKYWHGIFIVRKNTPLVCRTLWVRVNDLK